MAFTEECAKYFGSSDLYKILNLNKGASEKEIKKAYKRLSLLVHPDRVAEDGKKEATQKFQTLSKIHLILTDQEKRAIYDETGQVDDEDVISDDRNWFEYWRLLFPRVTEQSIVKCLNEYKGSQDERNDLQTYYLRFKGDMNKISEYLIGYEFKEEERYSEIINELIKQDLVPSYLKFTNESAAKKNARKRRNEKESAEAEEMLSEMNDSLSQAILKRSSQRYEDMMSELERKYCKPSPAGKGKRKSKK